jgi:hypothetical protein
LCGFHAERQFDHEGIACPERRIGVALNEQPQSLKKLEDLKSDDGCVGRKVSDCDAAAENLRQQIKAEANDLNASAPIVRVVVEA